jgi:sigma-B regulation protein RsbU (phosphoserine phosphatase)
VPADERSGPGLVMRTHRPLLAGDIGERDPTPWAPAWLLAEGFRGHAVAPLLVEDRSVGVLVIDQRQPRQLREDDVRFLCLMANQAAVAIEKARLHEEEVKAEALEKDLALARQIQLSLLPQAPPVVPGWEFAAFYEAARVVGGDFYDFFVLPGQAGARDGRMGVVVADVAGKGVPAALFMARCSTLIRGAGLSGGSPAAALMQANELILQDRRSQLFLTAFYGVLDTRGGRLEYANAGHNRPLWWQASTGQFQELAAPGIVLGMLGEIELEERAVDMAPGDLVVFYTDGVTEAMDANNQQFGQARLQEVVTASSGASAQQVLEAIVDGVRAFTGDVPLWDDVTVFVARRSR